MHVRSLACALALCAASVSVAAAPAAKAKASTVTITGCVEHRDKGFRLTDTDGAQAPKSRSWKTGFVTKRSAALDLVDGSKKVRIQDHLGHRDAVTGVLQDREFRAQSLRHLGSSCDR